MCWSVWFLYLHSTKIRETGRHVGRGVWLCRFVLQALSVKVTPGKVTPDNRQRLEQEESAEEKRLAIMMMKKRDKYLYDKIIFGKKRKVREVRRRQSSPTFPSVNLEFS